jgi:hypothetical protein
MELTQTLLRETENSTVSQLTCGSDFLGYVIEDGHRAVKVMHETRIPGGRFPLRPITWGKFYERYKKAYGHEFAIEIGDVPNFKYIRYHQGRKVTHTSGCPLNNWGFIYDPETKLFTGVNTEKCYINFYNYLKPAFDKKLEVWVTIKR